MKHDREKRLMSFFALAVVRSLVETDVRAHRATETRC
jgi:hypothetical protein